MTLSLRPYQRAAIEALYDYFSASSGNPLVVMPTGTGKRNIGSGPTKAASSSSSTLASRLPSSRTDPAQKPK